MSKENCKKMLEEGKQICDLYEKEKVINLNECKNLNIDMIKRLVDKDKFDNVIKLVDYLKELNKTFETKDEYNEANSESNL